MGIRVSGTNSLSYDAGDSVSWRGEGTMPYPIGDFSVTATNQYQGVFALTEHFEDEGEYDEPHKYSSHFWRSGRTSGDRLSIAGTISLLRCDFCTTLCHISKRLSCSSSAELLNPSPSLWLAYSSRCLHTLCPLATELWPNVFLSCAIISFLRARRTLGRATAKLPCLAITCSNHMNLGILASARSSDGWRAVF